MSSRWPSPELDISIFYILHRHPSWRSEETQERERSRTGSESSQTGTSATSGRSKSDQGGYQIIAHFYKLSMTKSCRDFGVLNSVMDSIWVILG